MFEMGCNKFSIILSTTSYLSIFGANEILSKPESINFQFFEIHNPVYKMGPVTVKGFIIVFVIHEPTVCTVFTSASWN
jgi:hypothetical protein